jgi:hypothetical protein
MIRVRVEMCPLGDERPEAVREIGRAYIANVGGNAVRGDYEVAVCRRGSTAVPAPIDPSGPKATRSGRVGNYPRLAYNMWRLIHRAILACFAEEIPVACSGKNLGRDERDLFLEPTDEQAAELGREILPGTTSACAIGRAAWLRGARPTGYIGG